MLTIAARVKVEVDDVVEQFTCDAIVDGKALRPNLPKEIYNLYSEYACDYHKETKKFVVTMRYKKSQQAEIDKLGMTKAATIDATKFAVAAIQKTEFIAKVVNYASPVKVFTPIEVKPK